jgi:hypothetical protein
LFKSGKHFRLFEKLGSHTTEYQGVAGTYFAVWAPSAKSVSVIGNFNYWNKDSHHLFVRWDESGIWEGFIPHIGKGEAYKYCIEAHDGRKLEKLTLMRTISKHLLKQHRLYGITGTNGQILTGWQLVRVKIHSRLQCLFMKYISAHGVVKLTKKNYRMLN